MITRTPYEGSVCTNRGTLVTIKRSRGDLQTSFESLKVEDHPSKIRKPRPKWMRVTFSLRALLVVMTLVAIGLGWFSWRFRQSSEEFDALAEIRLFVNDSYQDFHVDSETQSLDRLVKVKYDYQFDRQGNFVPDAKPWIPSWLEGKAGRNSLSRVVSISLSTRYDYDCGDGVMCADHTLCDISSLDFLLKFRNLRELELDIGLPPDLDISALGEIKSLQRLSFSSPPKRRRFSGGTPLLPLDKIKNLKRLKSLQVKGRVEPAKTKPLFKLKELFLSKEGYGNENPDLDDFGDLSQLKRLNLYFFHKQTQLSSATGFPNLTHLNLTRCGNENMDAFSRAPIEELRLDGCRKLNDISGVSDSNTIRKLELCGCGSSPMTNLDLNPEKVRFPSLEEVNFISARNTIDFLRNSPKLKRAILQGSRIKDLSALSDLSQLEILKLDCRNLERFDCDLNQIRELTMKVTPEFKHFDILSRNDCQLEHLDLRLAEYHKDSELTELDCLGHAKRLRSVSLHGIGIKDFDCLASCKNLERVILCGNPNLNSIAGLGSAMGNLSELHIHDNNQLLDYSVLANPAGKLTQLTVSNVDYSSGSLVDLFKNTPLKLPSGKTNSYKVLWVPGLPPVNKKVWDSQRYRREEDLNSYLPRAPFTRWNQE